MLLELFAQMISDKCFDQLRTQEQLGMNPSAFASSFIS